VLASGDPFFYGIGSLIAAHIPEQEWQCLPAPSSFSLAAARLRWSLQDCSLLSLHGRAFERVYPYLQPSARLLCLSWDHTTPALIAASLRARNMGQARVTVLERMGGPYEKIRTATAQDFALEQIDPLNLAACEIVADSNSTIIPLGSGLPDEFFEHDGQITKQEIRAMTLSALRPRQGDVLWDIGAGSGSIGIEFMLLESRNRAYAVEPRQDRAERIFRNAKMLGVPGLKIVLGKAPEALQSLPEKPDCIFIGGGASAPHLIDQCYINLRPGGRLVVNAVTVETEALVFGRWQTYGGTLKKIEISQLEAIGGFHAFRPALPVTQWAVTKL
jgi:precorrin-6Y C5,15-methyltransferase (decarboxylating)